MARVKTPVDEKFEKQDFNLFEAIAAIDKKDYGYYDRLTTEQQRKFVPFMMVHWIIPILIKHGKFYQNIKQQFLAYLQLL